MSFNSKEKENYQDRESEQQMKAAFANNPVRNNDLSSLVDGINLDNLGTDRERKISVSITMTPTMKEQLTALAKKHGKKSMSAFVVELFQAIIDKDN
mgnify:CR=1 FL=1